MELRDVYLLAKRHFRLLVLASLFSGMLGFFYPRTYTAVGSFFVTRTAENRSNEYFTYEGFYSQQSALSFADTVIGLMESVDMKKKALVSLNIVPDENSLRGANRRIRVRKAAPQLVTLQVKGRSLTQARDLWLALSGATLQTIDELKSSGDASVRVTSLQETPVVREGYRSALLNLGIGAALGFLTALISVSFWSYVNSDGGAYDSKH